MATSRPSRSKDSPTDKDHLFAYVLQCQEIITGKNKETGNSDNLTSRLSVELDNASESGDTKVESVTEVTRSEKSSDNVMADQSEEVPHGIPNGVSCDDTDTHLSKAIPFDSDEELDEASREIQHLLETSAISQTQAKFLQQNKNLESKKNVEFSGFENDYEGEDKLEKRRHSIGQDEDDEDEISREIEELHKGGTISASQAELMTDRRKTMKELNKNLTDDSLSGLIPFPFDQNGFPTNWSCTDISSDYSNSLFSLVELGPGELEYDQIDNELWTAGIEITKLERLENVDLLHRYKSEIQHIKRRRPPDYNLNSRYLYHGTKVDKLRICEEGLDQRLSRMGFFGKGIYFSDNPLKCVHYTDSTDCLQESYILKCRVILGDSKVFEDGKYDTSLKREPEKESPTGGYRFYDSVMGCPKDFNEFVVYDNRRAMIEYIISFTLSPTGARQLRQRQPSPTFNKQKQQLTAGEPVDVSDEQHFEHIRQVREAIRKKRTLEKGEPYIAPTPEQIQKDKDTWLRLQRLNGIPTKDDKQEPTKMSRSHQSYNLSSQAATGSTPDASSSRIAEIPPMRHQIPFTSRAASTNYNIGNITDLDPDPVSQVMTSLIQDFLVVTSTNDEQAAKYYIEKAQMDVNQAIVMYYEDLP